jgi:pyridinium-3,5-biscarboxylic acid mononucleotide sulfurtransferase
LGPPSIIVHMKLTSELNAKYGRMREILRELERVAVAFSAGADSMLVLKVAVDELGPENVVAVTGDSESLARSEFEEAVRLAESVGAEHAIIRTREFEKPEYLANEADRCYHCKSELYSKLGDFIRERGLKAVVSGINADDFGDFRPGIQAGNEQGVRAPCAEAGMTKRELRDLSAYLGLPTFDKPASPCLASRIEPGEEITPEKLRMVEEAEAFLRQLGLRELRVRHHGKLARIEVPSERIEEFMKPAIREQIHAKLREIGYTWVSMDLKGFRSGSTNPVVAFGRVQPVL